MPTAIQILFIVTLAKNHIQQFRDTISRLELAYSRRDAFASHTERKISWRQIVFHEHDAAQPRPIIIIESLSCLKA